MRVKVSTIVQLVFIAVAAIAVYGFVRAAQNDQRYSACSSFCAMGPTYAGRDRMAPDFELPDLNGKPTKLSSFRGKTVFLNFWTKTCKPCLEEMPALGELGKVLKKRSDMVLVTVSTDEGVDDVRDTLKVVLNEETPFIVLLDPESTVVRDKFGTKLFPETWIIDPKGIIRARFDGVRDWSDAAVITIGEMVKRPAGCPVEFFRGQPKGKFAALCADEG
ncbi:MAG: TlpA family protein disulfide reductase [Polyangiaceae bacterium]|nr:TlpA family protein disulfide reductase [Polyangiaceae bacterium]